MLPLTPPGSLLRHRSSASSSALHWEGRQDVAEQAPITRTCAQCTTSCRLSPISAVRSLEECFLAVTRLKVAEGIAKFDQLVQLIQASVILGLYFSVFPLRFAQSEVAGTLMACLTGTFKRRRAVKVKLGLKQLYVVSDNLR